MARMIELFEVSFGFNVMLFEDRGDAAAFAGLLCKGAKAEAAANPLNPQARVTLSLVEPSLRRVFVPVSERACICAFGRRLKSAGPKIIAEQSEEGTVNEEG